MYNATAPTRSLYLHWPFCPYKCHFCPFVALASHDQFMGQYHQALTKEIARYGQEIGAQQPIDTIFLGGGTPSTYPNDLLLDTFDTLRRYFLLGQDTEITIEVNPGTVKEGKLEVWKQAGINRLSIGVQGLNDGVLKSLNRHQTITDVHTLLHNASQLFENISVDLILGLPGISHEAWKNTIAQAVQWPIKHLSMYFLTVHEDTPLYFGVKTKKILLPGDEDMIALYHWSVDALTKAGFLQYEISNFARPGFESRHNMAYWQRVPYKAFGLGACSFDGTSRFQNEKNLMKYMEAVERGGDITFFQETLTKDQIFMEKVMLGLRQRAGIQLHELFSFYEDTNRIDALKEKIALFERNHFLARSGDVVVLTPAGLAVQNEIVTQLCV